MKALMALLVLLADSPDAVAEIAVGLARLLGLLGPDETLTPEQLALLEEAARDAKTKLDAEIEKALGSGDEG